MNPAVPDPSLFPSVIDLVPVASAVLQLVAAVVIGWLGKLGADAATRAYLTRILEVSVGFALNSVATAGYGRVDVRNALTAAAANYVIRAAPGALRRFGIDRDRLEDMILARLPGSAGGEAAASGDRRDPLPDWPPAR